MRVGEVLAHQILHDCAHLANRAHHPHAQLPCKLVDMAVQALGLNVAERPVVPEPYQDPEQLYSVDVHLVPDVLAVAVFYGLVVLQTVVRPVLVGEFLRAGVRVVLDKLYQAGGNGLWHEYSPDCSPRPVPDIHDRRLLTLALLAGVLVLLAPTQTHLNGASHQVWPAKVRHDSLSLCNRIHAEIYFIPRSWPSCTLDIPLDSVASRYVATAHLR